MKQLFGNSSNERSAISGTASPASLQLHAAFINSMAGIAADAILQAPATAASRDGLDDQSGHLMSLLMSAGGILHASQKNISQSSATESGSNLSSSNGSMPNDAEAHANVQAAIQHCLQVWPGCFLSYSVLAVVLLS